MNVKILFTKRMRRYACAAIATTVTTFVGLKSISTAEAQSCSLKDATQWQLAVTNPEVELTPTFIKVVTESFLRACPDRPEFTSASRIAAIAATDLGDAKTAVQHFRNAGPMRDVQSNFYAIAAHLAAGEEASAWQTRDRMVARWLDRLERHPLVSVSHEQLESGAIYQIHIADADPEILPRSVWVAVPAGPGWPATLSFTHDRMLLAMRQVRAGETDLDARYIDLNRCYGRRSLGRLDAQLTSVDFDGAARAGLAAYLADPDQHVEQSDRSIHPCYLSNRLLPAPSRS